MKKKEQYAKKIRRWKIEPSDVGKKIEEKKKAGPDGIEGRFGTKVFPDY